MRKIVIIFVVLFGLFVLSGCVERPDLPTREDVTLGNFSGSEVIDSGDYLVVEFNITDVEGVEEYLCYDVIGNNSFGVFIMNNSQLDKYNSIENYTLEEVDYLEGEISREDTRDVSMGEYYARYSDRFWREHGYGGFYLIIANIDGFSTSENKKTVDNKSLNAKYNLYVFRGLRYCPHSYGKKERSR